MLPETSVERYLSGQRKTRFETIEEEGRRRPQAFVTISRQAGAGGTTVGRKVADILNDTPHDVPWTVFDQELVGLVLKQHELPGELSKYLSEKAINTFQRFVEESLGIHPPTHALVRKTNETIAALAQMGRCILIGRGANFITRPIRGGFHVRLVATEAARVRVLQERFELGEKEALLHMKSTDDKRRRYVRDAFDRDVDDTLAYDCTINTTWLSHDNVAEIIASHVRKRVRTT